MIESDLFLQVQTLAMVILPLLSALLAVLLSPATEPPPVEPPQNVRYQGNRDLFRMRGSR